MKQELIVSIDGLLVLLLAMAFRGNVYDECPGLIKSLDILPKTQC